MAIHGSATGVRQGARFQYSIALEPGKHLEEGALYDSSDRELVTPFGFTVGSLCRELGGGFLAYSHCKCCSLEDAEAATDRIVKSGDDVVVFKFFNWENGASEGTHCLLLVPRQYASELAQYEDCWPIQLGNCQYLEHGDVVFNGGKVSEDWFMLHPFTLKGVDDPSDDRRFHLYPFNMMHLKERHASFSIFLNPAERKNFGKRYYCAIKYGKRGEKLFPLPVKYHREVPPGRVCLHETLLIALGFYPGGSIVLSPTSRRIKLPDRIGIIDRRRLLLNAAVPTDLDVGFPVARTSPEVIDLLGISPNQQVVLLSHFADNHRDTISLRCLPIQDPVRTPPVRELNGSGDLLYNMAVDLVRREQLGLNKNDPIIVRPAYLSLLMDEFSWLVNTVIVGVAATTISENYVAAGVTGTLLVVLMVGSVLRRFR